MGSGGDIGRVPSGNGLSSTTEPASGLRPTGFDPARDNRPPKSYYERAEQLDALIWRLCEYRTDDCRKCPANVFVYDHGDCKNACRAIAEEMAALVMATCVSAPECEPVADGEGDWSEWIHPLPGYLMQCCDCGLIHEMEFAIGQRRKGDDGPLNEGETPRRVIVFRARRYSDRDGAEGGDANAAPVPQDRHARAEGIAQNPLEGL